MNGFILVINAISNSPEPDNARVIFKGRWFPTVVLALVGLALLYYWSVFAAHVPEPLWRWSILRAARSEALIAKEPRFDLENEEARRFGHRRSIYFRVSLLESGIHEFNSVLISVLVYGRSSSILANPPVLVFWWLAQSLSNRGCGR
jgi:hypothetical protein